MPKIKWVDAVAEKTQRVEQIVAGRIKAAGENGLVLADLITDVVKGEIKGARITAQEINAVIAVLKAKNLVVEEP